MWLCRCLVVNYCVPLVECPSLRILPTQPHVYRRVGNILGKGVRLHGINAVGERAIGVMRGRVTTDSPERVVWFEGQHQRAGRQEFSQGHVDLPASQHAPPSCKQLLHLQNACLNVINISH